MKIALVHDDFNLEGFLFGLWRPACRRAGKTTTTCNFSVNNRY